VRPVRESARAPLPIQAKNEKTGGRTPRTLRQQSAKDGIQSIQKKKIQDMDGTPTAEVNASAATERERSKQESM
jgi:hypothetical protein